MKVNVKARTEIFIFVKEWIPEYKVAIPNIVEQIEAHPRYRCFYGMQ